MVDSGSGVRVRVRGARPQAEQSVRAPAFIFVAVLERSKASFSSAAFYTVPG